VHIAEGTGCDSRSPHSGWIIRRLAQGLAAAVADTKRGLRLEREVYLGPPALEHARVSGLFLSCLSFGAGLFAA